MSSDSSAGHHGGANEDGEADELVKNAEARLDSDEEDEEEDGSEFGDYEEQRSANGFEDDVADSHGVLPHAGSGEADVEAELQENVWRRDGSEERLAFDYNGPSTPVMRSPAGSVADSGSIPDDLPSSLPASPYSTPGQTGSPASRRSVVRTPTANRQPFERRFEGRPLASSPLTTPRANSPAFLSAHSRQVSLSSQISQISSQDGDTDSETQAPWDVIRCTKLRKITTQVFSEAGKRNFGRPTCMAVSALIAIGTSKGIVLGFDYHQTLKIIIGPGTKATECGAVTALAIAADYSTIASGHANGHIFTWEISRPARPFLQIPPLDRSVLQNAKHDSGHLADCAVLHIGFLGTRHTALVSADSCGMAFSHLASRGLGPVTRTMHTTRLLGRYPSLDAKAEATRKPSSVLAFAPLPLGNVEQPTDGMGLTALLTPYLLVIVSTTPVAQTQHKSPRPKEVSPHSTLSGCLAWFPAVKLKHPPKGSTKGTSDTKLAYCWSNVVSILDVTVARESQVGETPGPPVLDFTIRSRWRAEEAIVAVQWLGRSVLGLLTISQRLLILEDSSLRVTDSIDLLHRHIYHQDLFSQQLRTIVEQLSSHDPSLHGVVADAFYMSFRAYKGRAFLLGFNDLSVGTLSNWADRLVALMETGDHIAAIRLALDYYSGQASNVTIGLPESDAARHEMVKERVLAMISASMKYTFAGDDTRREHLQELSNICYEACVTMHETDFLFSEVFDAFRDADEEAAFISSLEPYILDGEVATLPPEVVKAVVDHFIFANQAASLEELLCRLDPRSFDLDQITTLCRQHSLYDALIYIWTEAIHDYVSPLVDLLELVKLLQEGFANEDLTDNPFYASAAKVFPYLAFSLTGRRYPRGVVVDEAEADQAKSDVYGYLFSGSPMAWPPGSSKIFLTTGSVADEPAFPYLDLLLKFDIASFMSMLNEAFEDSFLNVVEEDDSSNTFANGNTPRHGQKYKMTRQHIIEIMLDVMRQGEFAPAHVAYLDMFIARSLPKYPGQLILSGSLLNGALERLCRPPTDELRDDCQLSVEYLVSAHRPPDLAEFIRALREARFYRVLKHVYRGEKMFTELIETYFDDADEREGVFACITSILHARSGLTESQTTTVKEKITEHFLDLVAIDVVQTARTLATAAPDLLQPCLDVLPASRQQFLFLRALLEPARLTEQDRPRSPLDDEHGAPFLEPYVRLMCEHDPTHVADYTRALPSSNLHLDAVLPAMEASGVIDAAVFLLARDGLAREAMDRLVAHLHSLEHALTSLIDAMAAHPDAGAQDTAAGLAEDIEKYVKVGIWLCTGQTQTVQRTPRPRTAAAWDVKEDDLDLDEFLWLNLLDAAVQVTQNGIAALRSLEDAPDPEVANALDAAKLAQSLRTNVQQVFTTVLATTSAPLVRQQPSDVASRSHTPATDAVFLRILRAFLTRAAQHAPSLAELRAVLADILSVYSFEQDVLRLATDLLASDLFVDMHAAHAQRQRGWRPRTQVCEQCKRRAWGTGIGDAVWRAWAAREQTREMARSRTWAERAGGEEGRRVGRGKGKVATPVIGAPAEEDHVGEEDARRFALVVFACRHVFHRVCLDEEYKAGRAPSRGAYACPLCVAKQGDEE